MPGQYHFIDGHGRATLITRVTSQITQGGSQNFGQFYAAGYSRFTGYLIANSVGNTGAVFRYRFAQDSGGPFQVSSAITVSSGATAFSGTIVDVLNYGRYIDAAIISADSTTQYSLLLMGEPLR